MWHQIILALVDQCQSGVEKLMNSIPAINCITSANDPSYAEIGKFPALYVMLIVGYFLLINICIKNAMTELLILSS